MLLAGGPHEEHVLALYAVRARLAERDVPARLPGPRTPISALAAAAQRTRSPGVLVWLGMNDPETERDLPLVIGAHRRMKLVVRGAGWTLTTSADVTVALGLDDAAAAVLAAA